MDKATLLKMRGEDENGMSNKEIADALHVNVSTIYNLIGKQPDWITKKNREAGYVKMAQSKRLFPDEGGHSVKRKMQSFMPQREEPVKAVLVMKSLPPQPIPLHGEFMDYVIDAERKSVDVETEQGRVLLNVPADKLGMFIEELQAIQKNIGSEKPMPFWG